MRQLLGSVLLAALVSSAAQAQTLTISPSSVEFGNQAINTSSLLRSITLTNNGNLVLSPLFTISGEFSRPASCLFLNPFSSCNVFVRFAPTSAGPKAGALTITSAATGSPHIVQLSGTGVDLVLSPSSVSLGSVRVGLTGTRTALLTNNSPNPVTIGSISVSGVFSQVNTCEQVLAAGENCSIEISATPASTGFFSGLLTVTDDAIGSPHTAALSVTGGVGNLLLDGTILDFPVNLVGVPSAERTVTLSNIGTAPLAISGITLPGDFVQTNNCGTTIPNGSNCTMSVRFLPTAEGLRNGLLTIAHDGSGSQQFVSLSGTGVLAFPKPVITAMSPDTRVVGAAHATLTLTGTGFLPQSVVRWAGLDRPTEYVSGNTLTAAIPATDFGNKGTFGVSVFNPAPGGGISSNFDFVVVQPIALATKDLVYDRLRDRIYGSVGAAAAVAANTLTPINPTTGAIEPSLFIGSDPGKLDISDDSTSIYILLDGTPMVQRFDTVSQTPHPAFALDNGNFAVDIAIAPGQPQTIAVSRWVPGTPRHHSIAIYDNGVKRPTETPDNAGSNVIEFSATAPTLYGINNETSEFPFRTMAVVPSGVTVTGLKAQLIIGADTDLQFENGRIYASNGRIADPISQTLVGTFPLPLSGGRKSMVVDSVLERAFFLVPDSVFIRILAFDIHTFEQKGTLTLTLPNPGSTQKMGSLIRWGANGLAFRAENQVLAFEIPEHWIGPPTPIHDFNGNGKSDVLWRNSADQLSMWLMNGNTVAADSLVGTLPQGLSISGVGDFNANGKADILLRGAQGDVWMWMMNGTVISQGAFIGNVWTGWSIVGTGDFNGDRKADILWRSTAGDVAIWLMNGANVINSSVIGNVWIDWKIVGTGDFNGDGKADILWRDSAGNVAMWMMNGLTVTSNAVIANIWPSWSVVGTGDFNGDSKADILWHDTGGSVAMWLMDGSNITSSTVIANVWHAWKIVGTGDYNGDGKADMLWRDTAGNVSVWLMDGPAIMSQTGMGNVSDRMAQ